MNIRIKSLPLMVLIACFSVFLAACNPAALNPTVTPTKSPAPTKTPNPTDTPTPRPSPTATSTPMTNMVRTLAALYNSKNFDPGISGVEWDFQRTETYGPEGACLIYWSPEEDEEENESALLLCANTATSSFDPIVVLDDLAREWTELDSGLMYEGFGDVRLIASEPSSSNGTRYLAWFNVGIDSISIQINFNESVDPTPQEYYDNHLLEIFNSVFQKALADSSSLSASGSSFTPEEQVIADQYTPLLISESFLLNLIEEDWALVRYGVDYLLDDPEMPGMCQRYSSSLRSVSNCINKVGADFDLDNLMGQWYSTDWETIHPTQTLDYDYAFYGIWDDSWKIEGYILANGYLLYVHFDGIHIGIGASIADTLTEYVDKYIVKIMLENVSKLPE